MIGSNPLIAAQRAVVRPNILFIMADDLGYADVSCYGRRDYQTPAIDSLARDGMRFMNAYANSPVCSATRTALITGGYQYRLPVGLEEPLVSRDLGLPPEIATMPSLLKRVGYHTALIGKWHLGRLPKFGPLQSGYDDFWGIRGGGIDYFREGHNPPDLWDGDVLIEQTGYMTDLLGDQAVAAVHEYASKPMPFFMSLHFTAPHWPWEGPGDQEESRRLAPKGRAGQHHLDGGTLKTYAEMVVRMDQQIARVLKALADTGVDRNTIVVFTSDNGGERFSDTWPFTGKKSELLEGGIRVPAIVRWPDRVAAGTTSDQIAMSMDWLPTFLAAAGVASDPDYPLDGIDLSAALDGKPAATRTVFWRYKYLGQQACRSGDYKYLKIGDNSFLFDIVADPLERGNLKDRMPEKFASLKSMYDAWNTGMLPLDPESYTGGYTGENMADRFGVTSDMAKTQP